MPIKDLAPYLLIMQYPSRESIDAKALGEKLKLPVLSIASMIRNASEHPSVFSALRAKGYAESQIPAWFAREKAGKKRDKRSDSENPQNNGPIDEGASQTQKDATQRTTDVSRSNTDVSLSNAEASQKGAQGEQEIRYVSAKKAPPEGFITLLGQNIEVNALEEKKPQEAPEDRTAPPSRVLLSSAIPKLHADHFELAKTGKIQFNHPEARRTIGSGP